MNLALIKSDTVYRELLQTPMEKRDSLFKERLLAPFKEKFDRQHISFDEHVPFNVMTLMGMMHKMPQSFKSSDLALIDQLDQKFWKDIQDAFAKAIGTFEAANITPKVSTYTLTALLGDAQLPMMQINENYSGDGGIPGYILLSIVPNAYTLNRISSAVAHECNHNIRYQFIEWGKGPLKEMIVSEGLAENFAEKLYGTDNLGPWVTKHDMSILNDLIKPKLKAHLDIDNMFEAMPYLYGDEITEMQQGKPVGLPYAAGYMCGYYLVKYYLKKTGLSIEAATLKTADEILDEASDFWQEITR